MKLLCEKKGLSTTSRISPRVLKLCGIRPARTPAYTLRYTLTKIYDILSAGSSEPLLQSARFTTTALQVHVIVMKFLQPTSEIPPKFTAAHACMYLIL